MAFAVTSRVSDTGATAAQSKTTASFTPTANSLLVVVATAQRENHTTASAWSITDSAGLTWTARPGVSTNITGSFGGDLICWTAPVGGSPAAMTVTVDPWSTSVTGWIGLSIFDITGHNVSTPLAQAGVTNTTTSTGNSVSLTVTLGSAPSSSNLVVAVFTGQNDATGAFTSISGFTELQNPTGINDHIGVWYRTGTTTAAVTCTDLGQTVNWGAGVVLEIAAVAGGTDYSKTPADPVGITDARTVVRTVVGTQGDGIGVSDSAARVAAAARIAADSVGVSDSVARTIGRVATRNDPVGITDSVSAVVATVRTVADPAGVTDARTTVRTSARTVADPVGVTDSPVAQLGQSVANPVGITDARTVVRTAARTAADLVGVTDSVSANLAGGSTNYTRTPADPVGVTDSTARAVAYVRSVTDAIGVTDTGSPQTIDFGYTLVDSTGVTDLAARTMAAVRARNDAVGIVDSASSALSGGGTNYSKTPTDYVGVTDARTAVWTTARAVADPAGITDTRTVVRTSARAVADPAGVTDVRTVARAVPRSDGVGVTDVATRVLARGRAQSDAVGLVDSLVVVRTKARAVSDLVGVVDSAAVPPRVVDDPNPITLAIRDSGHIARIWDTGHIATVKEQ